MSGDWIARAETLTLRVRNFIDGRWTEPSGQIIEKNSPRDGRVLYRLAAGDPSEADAATASARRAFADGRWSKLAPPLRKSVLQKFATLLEEHAEEFALLECLDVGKPIAGALSFDVPAAAAIIRYNAEALDKVHARVYGADGTGVSFELRRPVGVVAGIVGWNFPIVLAAGKIGPALAAGNSLVLKPSELTSLSTARMAELAAEAGVPPGVLNVVHGTGHLGSALAHHGDVDLITFTGSTQTGKRLLVASGESNLKRLILECGGKAPHIVFDDSPALEAVADAVVQRAFWNQGQVCTASARLLVHEAIRDELLERVIAKTALLNLGDPLIAETQYGALVSQDHKRKVLDYINAGAGEGARLAYQSRSQPPHENGSYVAPVIFDNVAPSHRIAQEEIFGPVLSVMSFRDEAEAIRIANSTIYGLSAILWTKDLGRAHRVADGVKVGWMVVNATEKPEGRFEDVLSVGGHRQSGIGVEGGLAGLEAFTNITAVQIHV